MARFEDFLMGSQEPGAPVATFGSYLNSLANPSDTPTPQANDSNWLTSGIGAGWHGMLSEGARAAQAGAQLMGADETAKSLADYAETHRATAKTFERPDLEAASWLNPKKLGYEIAKMVPMAGGAMGAAGLAAIGAPEEAAGVGLAALLRTAGARRLMGASAAMYPTAVGGNVQRQIDETGKLTDPGTAFLLGAPEAAAQGVLPGLGIGPGQLFSKGVIRGAVHGAATQAGASGATEFLTQLMGDPNRSFADRAAAIGESALSGGALGGFLGGAFGGYRKYVAKSPKDFTNEDMTNATDPALGLKPSGPPTTEYKQAELPLPRVPEGLQDLPLFSRRPAEASAVPAAEAPAAAPAVVPEQLPLPLPRVPEGLQDLPLFAQRPEQGPAAPAAPEPAASVPASETSLDRQMREAGVPPRRPGEPLLTATQEEIDARMRAAGVSPTSEPVAPAAPAESVPVAPALNIDFTARLTEKNFKEGMAQVAAAPAEVKAATRQQLIDTIVARGDKPLTKGLQTWGKGFGLLDKDGELRDEFIPKQPVETPPGVEPEAPPEVQPGERLSYASAGATRRERGTLGEPAVGAPEAPGAVAPTADIVRSAADMISQRQRSGTVFIGDIIKELRESGLTKDQIHAAIADAARSGQATLAQSDTVKMTPEQRAGVLQIEGERPFHTVTYRPAPVAAGLPAGEAETGLPDFLRRAKSGAAPTPEMTALNGMRDEIATLRDPEAQRRHTAEADTIENMLPRAARNPGMVPDVAKRLGNLKTAIDEARTRPADAVAFPDLEPSPRAEAKPAPMNDLQVMVKNALGALGDLREKIGGLAGAPEAFLAHDDWLKSLQAAKTPEEFQAALAAEPKNLTDLEKPNKQTLARINGYMAVQNEVTKALRDQTGLRARVIASRDGLPVTQLGADIADMAQRGVRPADAASHLIEHTADPEEAEIVSKLQAALPKDMKMGFRDDVLDKEGEYFPKSKTIMLYNAGSSVATFIHELAHAVYHRALEAGGAAAGALRGIYDQLKHTDQHAGITDAHEMLSEASANPVYRAFLKSQVVRGASLWDRLVDVGRGMIGLDPRLYNAFDRIMSHGDDLLKEQERLPNEWNGPDSYARVVNSGAKSVGATANAIRDTLLGSIRSGLLDVATAARPRINGWINGYWKTQDPTYNKLSPSLPLWGEIGQKEDPRRKQLVRGANAADRQVLKLPPEEKAVWDDLTAKATSYKFNPEMTTADYTDRISDPEEYQKLKEVQGLYNQLTPAGKKAYHLSRAQNWNFGLWNTIHDLQEAQRSVNAPVDDLFNKLHTNNELTNSLDNPQKTNEILRKELNNRLAANEQLIKDLTTQKAVIDAPIARRQAEIDAAVKAKMPGDQLKALKEQDRDQLEKLAEQSAALGSKIGLLNEGLKDATKERNRMEKEPYFHLGRDGDFFSTGKLVMAPGAIDPETGKPGAWAPDKNMLNRLGDHLEKNGINDVALIQGSTNDTFYAKVESQSQLKELDRVLRDAQKKGLLAPEDKAPIKSGKILDDNIFNRVSSQGMRDILARLAANPPQIPEGVTEDIANKLIAGHYNQMQNLRADLLNMTPANSVARLMAQRKDVQGFAKDMRQSQARYADAMASNLARMTLQPERSAAEAAMLKELGAANAKPLSEVSLFTRTGLADTIEALLGYQKARQTYVPRSPADAARNVTNSMFLGMQPAYFLMNTGQLFTTGIPELMKTHGYPMAVNALGRATPKAFSILRAVVSGGEGMTADILREDLEKYKLPKPLIDTVMGMVLRGSLQTYTGQVSERAPLGESAVGKVSATALKAANVIGLYADVVPRLIMGLAADELYSKKPYPGMTREQFIDSKIIQSQGYYGTALGARQTSRYGFAGAMTPMFTQFMQFNLNMVSKIYQEAANAFFRDDKQKQAEGRLWLAGHAAAITMVAGTLGLPLVSVAASVYDRLMDWATDSDDHNLLRSYQTFLESHLGKDFGEIVARGLPRAAGADLANWGEANIVPGSAMANILLEKRKFDDMKGDWFKGEGGPALNQMFTMVDGLGDIMDGDYNKGMIKLMPGLIKDLARTYQLTNQGFVDQHGQQLPIMSPNAWDIMQTALGLHPEKQVAYQEVQRDLSGLRARRQASSANISDHLRQAYTTGDSAMFDTWMRAAERWQETHPGLMPPQATFGRELALHQRLLSMAQGTGLPLGMRPNDIRALELFGGVR